MHGFSTPFRTSQQDIQDAFAILKKFVDRDGRAITYRGPDSTSERDKIASLALYKHVEALSREHDAPPIGVGWLAEAIDRPAKRVHTLIGRIDFLERIGKSTYRVNCPRLTEAAYQLRPDRRAPRQQRNRPLDSEKPPPRQMALSG